MSAEPVSICYLFGVCHEQMNKGTTDCHFQGENFSIEGKTGEDGRKTIEVVWRQDQAVQGG